MKTQSVFQLLAACVFIIFGLWRMDSAPEELNASAVAAYERGDFVAATELFQQAVSALPTTLLQKNLALAAFQADHLKLASTAAASIASDDPAWHDFLLGNLAWRRSMMAETEAHGPVPPAGCLERAIAQAEAAGDAWESALEMRDSWLQAKWNLALVETRISALQEELQSTLNSGDSETEKLPSPSSTATQPMMNETKRIQMMQQLQRLDQQKAAQHPAPKPKPSGGWEW
ncbi:MAG: hypothetical protein QM477_11020 [Planctomycetota bacterium]